MAENLYTVRVESRVQQNGYVYVEARDEEHLKALLEDEEFVKSLEHDIEWGESDYISDFEVTDVELEEEGEEEEDEEDIEEGEEEEVDPRIEIEQCLKDLQTKPSNAQTWGNLGWWQYCLEQFDEAAKSNQESLSIAPELAYVRHNLGLVYAVQGKEVEAQKEYDAAVTVSTLSDIRVAIEDLNEAGKKWQGVQAIGEALNLLQAAERRLQETEL